MTLQYILIYKKIELRIREITNIYSKYELIFNVASTYKTGISSWRRMVSMKAFAKAFPTTRKILLSTLVSGCIVHIQDKRIIGRCRRVFRSSGFINSVCLFFLNLKKPPQTLTPATVVLRKVVMLYVSRARVCLCIFQTYYKCRALYFRV